MTRDEDLESSAIRARAIACGLFFGLMVGFSGNHWEIRAVAGVAALLCVWSWRLEVKRKREARAELVERLRKSVSGGR